MPRKERPVKIKRYGNNHNRYANTAATAKKVAMVLCVLLAVAGLGFFLGRPLVKALAGKKDKGEKPPVSSQITAQQTDEPEQNQEPEQAPDNTVTGGIITPMPEKTRVYYYAQPANLTYARGMDSAISAAKAAGANCFVFDLKDNKGNILYASNNELAKQLLSTTQIDVATLVAKLGESGLTPVARIYTFMDQMISTVERSTAVMYEGTDTRWLDSSAALGGKCWANPASTIMQKYITDLTDEVMSLGVKEIIYAGFSTPTGYSLDKRDFGTSMDGVLANMKSLISTLKGRVSAKGGYCSWQIEYSALAPEGSYRQYIVHPYQLGMGNYIVTAPADADIASIVPALTSAQNGEDIKSITLWVAGTADKTATQALGNYFVN